MNKLPPIFYELTALPGNHCIKYYNDDTYGSYAFSFKQLGIGYRFFLRVQLTRRFYHANWENTVTGTELSFLDLLERINDPEQQEFLLFNLNLFMDKLKVFY